MKLILCLSLGLLALLPGGQGAAGQVGDVCSSTNTCTDSNAYCDTTAKKCKCNSGWIQNGQTCVRGVDQPCGNSQCLQNGMCDSKTGTCTCDTTRGLQAGSTGDSTCSCPTDQHVRTSDGKCVKNLGQTCSANSDCGDNAVCDTTCKCDASKYYTASGATSCICDTTKAIEGSSGNCLGKVGQDCSASLPCVVTDGMICSSGKCACDTSKNFNAGTDGDSTCACATNYGKKSDKTCGKLAGQSCGAGDTCVDHATCNGGTCTCDDSSSWEAATTTNLCQCKAATHALKSDNTCGLIIGQDCTASTPCIDYAVCDGTTTKCKCDANLNRDATTGAGATSCPCDSNSVENDGVCYKKVGQTCSDVSECIKTAGMVCQDVSGTKKCTCSTSSNYAAGSDGDTSCLCTSNYNKETDGTCALKVGQDCSASGAVCIHGAVCDDKTSKCMCDTANNYKAGTAGDATCACADDAVQTVFNQTYCGKKVGGTCKAPDSANVCTSNAQCKGTSGFYTCQCAAGATKQTDRSCKGGAAGLFVSLTVLVTGLAMTFRLI